MSNAAKPTHAAKLLERILGLETFPHLGAIDMEFGDGTRTLVIGAHRVVYNIVADEIFVSRILTTGQDG